MKKIETVQEKEVVKNNNYLSPRAYQEPRLRKTISKHLSNYSQHLDVVALCQAPFKCPLYAYNPSGPPSSGSWVPSSSPVFPGGN